MRLVPRSRWPVLLILFLVASCALGYWIYWLAQPGSGVGDVDKSPTYRLVLFYF